MMTMRQKETVPSKKFFGGIARGKFMKFLELKGKLGSQHKFPRVMKGKMLEEWERFLATGSL